MAIHLGDSPKVDVGRRRRAKRALYGEVTGFGACSKTDFSCISSCLFVHYPVDNFVRADSNQVSFDTSNDTKLYLFGLKSVLLCLCLCM